VPILSRINDANKIASDIDVVIDQVKASGPSRTVIIQFNDYSYSREAGYTLKPDSALVTPEEYDSTLRSLNLIKTRALLGRQDNLSYAQEVVNKSYNNQVPELLKSGLQTTSGKSPQEIDQLFGDYLSSKNGAALRGLATARVADENKESLNGLIQQMKERRAGPLTINEPAIDPSIVNIQKSTGTFLNFGGQAIAGSSAILVYLQSIQILSSDFSPDCFTTGGPSLPPPSNFPPTFEPFPGFEEPSAVIREAVDPNNPKGGFLTREYPADDDNTDSADAAFPPGFIGVDAQNRIIAINRNSTERFGGRIFRFTLAKSQPSGGVRRTFAVQKRELVGAVNYFSIDIQIAHPALPVALVVGPKFPATTQSGDPIMTQDLYVADTDIVTNQKRVLIVPISQIDTIGSFYTDANGGEKNRNHIVGQPVVISDEFRLTGPSDMEVGPDTALTEPRNTPNSVIMLSDEDIIWAITHDSLGTYSAVKVLQVAGRRWSGLAFDDQGKFYFADYAAKEVYAMTFSQFTEAVTSSVKNNAPLISSNALLRQFAALVGKVDQAPGDIEIEQISTHPGGVLHVSTEHGIVPLNMPIVGQVGPNVREIRIKRMAGEEAVPIETAFASPIRTFRAVPSHEDLEALRATLSVKRVDLNGREVWSEQGVFLAAHGATFLDLQ
jgi:hypothetical protein